MKETNTGGGISFMSLLTLLFIGLKLSGHITWPWVWVLSPIWIGLVITLLAIVVVLIVSAIKS